MVLEDFRPFRLVDTPPVEKAFWHYGTFLVAVHIGDTPPTHWMVTKRTKIKTVLSVGDLPPPPSLRYTADQLMMRELKNERLEK